MALAKFLYHQQSSTQPSEGDSSYSDLGVVRELRSMANGLKKAARVAPRAADESLKWLDWPDYLQVGSWTGQQWVLGPTNHFFLDWPKFGAVVVFL